MAHDKKDFSLTELFVNQLINLSRNLFTTTVNLVCIPVFCNVCYADDIALIADTENDLQRLSSQLLGI